MLWNPNPVAVSKSDVIRQEVPLSTAVRSLHRAGFDLIGLNLMKDPCDYDDKLNTPFSTPAMHT